MSNVSSKGLFMWPGELADRIVEQLRQKPRQIRSLTSRIVKWNTRRLPVDREDCAEVRGELNVLMAKGTVQRGKFGRYALSSPPP